MTAANRSSRRGAKENGVAAELDEADSGEPSSNEKAASDTRRALKLVGPKTPQRLTDRLLPRLHASYWLRFPFPEEVDGKLVKRDADAFYRDLVSTHPEDVDYAKAALEHVQALAQTAVDRAATADRRATTIASAVAITVTLTVSGSSFVLDSSNLGDSIAQGTVAVLLALATLTFAVSAYFALAALIRLRRWVWEAPGDLPRDAAEALPKRYLQRAAHLRVDFAHNWEVADLKNRLVDNSLYALLLGLFLLVGVSLAVGAHVLWS